MTFRMTSCNPNSLMDSTTSPKVKTPKREGIGVCSLLRSTSGVKGCVGALRWGLGILTSKSITQTDLHKLNNTYSQNSPWPELGGSHHLPPYSLLCAWPRG
jgi:hypothetical protein